MNIYPYITIVDSSINRENLQKSENKIFPINGSQLYLHQCKNRQKTEQWRVDRGQA